MIPYAKGLSICRLDVELRENYSFAVLDPKNAVIAEKKMDRLIKIIVCDQRPPHEEDDWNVYGDLEVPNSLDRCTQDCDTNFIKVKHRYHVHFPVLQLMIVSNSLLDYATQTGIFRKLGHRCQLHSCCHPTFLRRGPHRISAIQRQIISLISEMPMFFQLMNHEFTTDYGMAYRTRGSIRVP